MDDLLQQTALALRDDWDLVLPPTLSEEAILKLLADRVVLLIERGPDAFYQLMYRLDISEKKLNAILGDEHMAAKIAWLIYERQLQKIESRRKNKSERTDTDQELKW